MNQVKNEYLLKIAGKEILLRPTFEALANIESAVGTLSHLSYRLAKGVTDLKHQLGFAEVCRIIFYSQSGQKVVNRAPAPEYGLEDIANLVKAEGLFSVIAQVTIYLGTVAAGDNMAPDLTENAKKNLSSVAPTEPSPGENS